MGGVLLDSLKTTPNRVPYKRSQEHPSLTCVLLACNESTSLAVQPCRFSALGRLPEWLCRFVEPLFCGFKGNPKGPPKSVLGGIQKKETTTFLESAYFRLFKTLTASTAFLFASLIRKLSTAFCCPVTLHFFAHARQGLAKRVEHITRITRSIPPFGPQFPCCFTAPSIPGIPTGQVKCQNREPRAQNRTAAIRRYTSRAHLAVLNCGASLEISGRVTPLQIKTHKTFVSRQNSFEGTPLWAPC